MPDSAALVGAASVALAATTFYYTALRHSIHTVGAKVLPFGEEAQEAHRRKLAAALGWILAVALVHLIPTLLFVWAGLTILSSVRMGAPADVLRVAVCLIALVFLLHLVMIVQDALPVLKKYRLTGRQRARTK